MDSLIVPLDNDAVLTLVKPANRQMIILERQATRFAAAIDCQIIRLMGFRLKLTDEQFARLRRLSSVSDKAHRRANRRFAKAFFY